MSTLTPKAQEVLRLFAKQMIRRTGLRIDLPPDTLQQHDHDEIIAFLAQEVEERTQGYLTVRYADPALFKTRGRNCLHVAVCPQVTAQNPIAQITSEMTLYLVCQVLILSKPASPESVNEYREWIAERERKRQIGEAATRVAKSLLIDLYHKACIIINNTDDDKLREQLQLCIRNGEQRFTLEDAAAVCILVGIDLRQFIS